MIGQSAGMLLFLTSLFLLFPATIPASIHNNRMESADEQYKCLQCPAGKGICGNTCKGYFCVKAVEHQKNSERRYCLQFLEPGQPKPGECKTFTSPLGHVETVCACIGDYCNGESARGASNKMPVAGASSLMREPVSFFPILAVLFTTLASFMILQ